MDISYTAKSLNSELLENCALKLWFFNNFYILDRQKKI